MDINWTGIKQVKLIEIISDERENSSIIRLSSMLTYVLKRQLKAELDSVSLPTSQGQVIPEPLQIMTAKALSPQAISLVQCRLWNR